jgi:heme-degrading monooxygenase HmoA
MISRQWRGLARPNRAEDYIQHLRTETFPALRKIPGFLDASILSRMLGAGVEFQVVSRWESLDAIAKFAGADPEVAVVPPEVRGGVGFSDRGISGFRAGHSQRNEVHEEAQT